MDIFRISAFILCAVVFISALDKYTPWAALLISVSAGALVILYIMPQITRLVEQMNGLFAAVDGGSGYAALLLRVTGISFAAQMTSQICVDAGQKAMGDKIELAARVFIAVCTLPLISDMMKLITSFLGG